MEMNENINGQNNTGGINNQNNQEHSYEQSNQQQNNQYQQTNQSGPENQMYGQGYINEHKQYYQNGMNNINKANPNNDKFATASFVLGIIALSITVICNCCSAFIPVVLGILGLVFGIVSIKNYGGCTYSKLGIIFSSISIGLSIIMVVLWVLLNLGTYFVEYMNYYPWV